MRNCKLKSCLLKIYEYLLEKQRRLSIRLCYRLHIMSPVQTIRYIIEHQCSISRFGDGELALMLNENANIGFQTGGKDIAFRLSSVFNENEKLLICLPRYLNSVKGCTQQCKSYWLNWGKYDGLHEKTVRFARTTMGRNYRFGDSLITRPYIDCQDPQKAGEIFALLKQLWNQRSLLIVEGEKTRLGIGNDLFQNGRDKV